VGNRKDESYAERHAVWCSRQSSSHVRASLKHWSSAADQACSRASRWSLLKGSVSGNGQWRSLTTLLKGEQVTNYNQHKPRSKLSIYFLMPHYSSCAGVPLH